MEELSVASDEREAYVDSIRFTVSTEVHRGEAQLHWTVSERVSRPQTALSRPFLCQLRHVPRLPAPASVTMPSANPTRLSVLDGSVRDGHEAGTGQGDGESYRGSAGARPANMRRSITDIQPQTSIESLRQRQRSRIPPSIRERRYSFDCMRNTPRLAHVMSARSMQVDVELRMTYHELKKREAQLEKLVRALTVCGCHGLYCADGR